MLRFILRRLLLLVPVLLGLTVLLLLWVHALPGEPARALLGERATDQSIATVNRLYGFDQPLHEQYLKYVTALLQGDLGSSSRTGQPVLETFLERFPATIELSIAALLFAVVLGVPLGYLAARKPEVRRAARRHGGPLDALTVSGSLLGVVVPVFFLAYLLKLVFAVGLDVQLGAAQPGRPGVPADGRRGRTAASTPPTSRTSTSSTG